MKIDLTYFRLSYISVLKIYTGRGIHKNVYTRSFLSSNILKLTKQKNKEKFALSDSKNILLHYNN